MKKFVFVLFLFAMFTFSVFCQNGVIRELTGEVEIKAAGAAAFVRASAGSVVSMNTIISTGFRSTAVIEIGSSVISVRPLTRLTLAEIQVIENTENVNLNLQAGRVRVDVNPPSSTRTNFTVQSPSATASVRGTSFEFDTINLNVDEGRVIFAGNSGPAVIVDAGNTSFIGAGLASADPADVISALLLPTPPPGAPPPEVIPLASSDSDVGFDVGLNF